ncbi:MAG: HAD-IB family phosphatase [Bacilli bacterium]|jgi:HAD superfamily phosphoserine phosphatase-like hydrolase
MNVYDFDKTIYDGDSTIDFYIFLFLRKKHIIFLIPKQFISFLKYVFKLISKEEFKESFYIIFQYFDNIDDYVETFWDKNIKKIKGWYLEQQRESDIIISASSILLLKPICQRLGIKYLIATDIDKKTGKHNGFNCYGEEKVIRFKNEFKNKKIKNFYTDSFSDMSLIKIAENAYIVKKDKLINYKNYQEKIHKKIFNLFLNRDFLLFIFCGGIGTLSNFVISLMISFFINPTMAYVIGYSLSIFITYYLNIKLIFNKQFNSKELIKFIISYIPNFLILFSFVAIFLNIFNWSKIIVYALAGLLGLPITYILVKLFAFVKGVEK